MKAPKTGLIYDPRMTEHKCKRKHPERPQRVKFIMKLLQQKFYTSHPHVEYLSTIDRVVTDENIRMVHPEKYIKHVSTLWPKTSHRSDITVLDTYFNEKTEKCAKLAIGGVLEGIDKIMSGQWENGFACVRPPGHHSGGRHTINGFCIYNNVAIGARHLLQNHKVGKVAIVDWDVHHGDGTQHVFEKEKNVLLISIHRYDRGTFYPAYQFGNVNNQGVGEGEGSKLNLPLDYVDEKFKQYPFQAPGDNQYIYLYHRIVEPVLKQYKPDFILVSCGFDAARGDPLGGFTVTPNGYYYMTKRLLQFQKPMLVVLQGGYNLESISNSAEAVMRALVHDDHYPEPIDVSDKHIKYKCQLPEPIHKQVDNIVEVLSQHWPNLKSEELKGYAEIVKGNQKRLFGIVEKGIQSSSSEQQDDDKSTVSEISSTSEASVSSSSSSHRYNTRSKTREAQHEQEKLDELKQLEKQQKQWDKMTKMKKKTDNKFTEQGSIQAATTQTKTNEKVVQSQHNQKKEKKVKEKAKKTKKNKQQQKHENQLSQNEGEGSVVNQFYFAAGHLQKFKNFSPKNEKIIKITYPEEIQFYEHITFEKEFTPKYYGKEGEDSIVMENLLFQQQDPVVVDIKLSLQAKNTTLTEQRREKERKKQEKSTSQEFGFRISGFTTPSYKEGGVLQSGPDNVKKILRNAVTLENKQLFCDFLTKLSHALSKSSRRYYGTSILLIKGPKKSDIRWIDFRYCFEKEASEGPDVETIKGVENLRKFIQELQISF